MIKSREYKGKHTRQVAPSIYSVNDLIIDYNRTSSGYFFSDDTMRFFKSRVLDHLITKGDVSYFITSERYDSSSKRLFTIRQVKRRSDRGSFYGYKYSIDTVGGFQEYKTSNAAKKAIEELIK